MSHFDACKLPGNREKHLGFRLQRCALSATLTFALAFDTGGASAQQPITRQQAIDAAVNRGARAAVAEADTLVSAAELLSARQWDNPSLGLTYSKSLPSYHEILDIPLDISGARSARIGAAQATRLASQYRFRFERAAAALDADTAYTRAQAALEHLRLARRNARDADSLRRMAVVRRDAGDASELDVALATVNAGEAANIAAADSLTLVSAIFDLQAVMGFDTAMVAVMPADSLTLPPSDEGRAGRLPLPVASAEQAVRAAELSVRAQRRAIFAPFSVQAGIEHGDPSERGLLPTFGVSLPIPFLNRNRGGIALAQAEQARARTELELVRLETKVAIGRAQRQRSMSLERIRRDQVIVESASRVVAMSLTAYREGAQGLPAVLEAQRNARDILSQYIDDLAEAWIATATLRLYNLTEGPQ
ncbi:MAG TPA: TolC family protein [Gemmatimonadaceae bacterium]|nr:TolC family protein [Gemmatimonadaceae bacterium]